MKKIYTEKYICYRCKKVVAEHSKTNKIRAVKSYATICLICLKEILKKGNTI